MVTAENVGFDVESVIKDFPVLARETNPGVPLVYLDSAATSQKPAVVIEAMDDYYRRYNANIHRGIHTLAEEATAAYEDARIKVAEFIRASRPQEIIFTRNTTEAINLVAQTWGKQELKQGDTVLLTEMEHHSNLVPWQLLAAERNLNLEFVPVTSQGVLDMEAYRQLIRQGPKILAVTHMSNVLGTINPAEEIVKASSSRDDRPGQGSGRDHGGGRGSVSTSPAGRCQPTAGGFLCLFGP